MGLSLRSLVFAAVVLAAPSFTAAASEPATPTVEKVLGFYQTEALLADQITLVEEALKRRKKEVGFPKERENRILGLAQRIYRKKNLYDVFKTAYTKNVTKETMAALYAWMTSVKGIKLRKGYAELYDETVKDWREYYDRNSAKILKPNRKNALQTYLKAAELHNVYASKHVGADLAVDMALNAHSPSESRDSIKVVKDRVRMKRTAYAEAGIESSLVMAMSLAKTLKNEEVDDLGKFSTSATGQAASQAYLKALDLTLESAASTLANEILKGTK